MRKGLFLLMGVLLASGCASESDEPTQECKDGESTYYCPESKVCGQGECVDLDENNCGAFGRQCKNGNVCDKEKRDCVCNSAADKMACSDFCTPSEGCVDTSTNPKYCGNPSEYVSCDIANGEMCVDGKCSKYCPENQEKCGNKCVDLKTDADNCGECNHACPAVGENHVTRSYCQQGQCQIICEKSYLNGDNDLSNGCETEVKFTCGNAVVEPGEACDGEKLNDETCGKQVGAGSTGTLTCKPDCMGFDTSKCSAPTTCGNGVVETGEICDGDKLNDKTCETEVGAGSTGTLTCGSDCMSFDTSRCSAPKSCGNGIVELGEQCDLSKLNDQTCETLVGVGSRGRVTCNADCLSFDTSDCTPSTTCGNGEIDGTEVCDGSAIGNATCESVRGEGSKGSIGCLPNCAGYDLSGCSAPTSCGNGKLDAGEQCDGEQMNNSSCESVRGRGSSGTLKCTDTCQFDISGCGMPSICGNNRVEDGELCDGKNFNGETCESLIGKGSTGTLICDDCGRILTTNCSSASTCGNNKIDAQEKCDGTALDEKTCADVVGEGSTGTLKCAANCGSFDVSGCTAASKCGDGVVQANEVCDGGRMNDRTCETEVGLGSKGHLKCNATCTGFDTSECTASTTCGNGIREAHEVCDLEDVNGVTCESAVGLGSRGTVLCGADCKYLNLSGCSAATTCGNGNIDAGEVCDTKRELGATVTCESLLGHGSKGKVTCGDGCKHYDTSKCSPPQSCGDGAINGHEVCDTNLLAGQTCESIVGFGSKGILACNASCSGFDTSKCSPARHCGNGVLDPGERCDGKMLNGATCSALVGYGSTGTPVCNDKCDGFVKDSDGVKGCTAAKTCGNGVLDPGERCDGGMPVQITCEEFVGYGSTGLPECNSTCTGYTKGSCTAAKTCGNGKLDEGEQCDLGDLNKQSCESLVGPGSTGTLYCDSNCRINTTNCSPARSCGNGKLDEGEQCDGKLFADDIKLCNKYAPTMYKSGSLKCNDNCQIDASECKLFCGDGVVNTSYNKVAINEACDGDKFPASQNTCAKVVGPGSTGTLSCANDCKSIVVSKCTAASVCGDGVINQSSEQCDGNDFRLGNDCSKYSDKYEPGAKVKCLGNCEVDTSACKEIVVEKKCGNGKLDEDEMCDGDKFQFDVVECSEWSTKYGAGKLSCSSKCEVVEDQCVLKSDLNKCGDGVVNANELCDGNAFYMGIQDCHDYWGEYVSGKLKCTNTCTIDESGCKVKAEPKCGNNIIEEGELCDGDELPYSYTACSKYDDRLYSKGQIKCSKDCKSIDVSACEKWCGNGSVNYSRGEVCDGKNVNKKTCEKVMGSGSTGSLGCASDCMSFDTSDCTPPSFCGDGIVNGDEMCDGKKFLSDERSCSALNPQYTSGSVTCNSDCTLNYGACKGETKVCGDGVINQASEECDGRAIQDGLTWECSDLDNNYTGKLVCGSDCKLNIDSCVLKQQTTCGNGKLEDYEECDGDKFMLDEKTCAGWDTRFAIGDVTCNKDCTINYDACYVSKCGNGKLEGDEPCDGDAFMLDITKCTDYSKVYTSGTLKCRKDCTVDTSSCQIAKCGDGKLDENEWCDGNKFEPSANTCDAWISGTQGKLSCTKTCEVDLSDCKAKPTAYCGDGIVNTASEECDGDKFLLDVTTCKDYSKVYSSGNLRCNPDCTVNVDACHSPTCGDGVLDDNEWCDGGAFVDNIRKCSEYSSSYIGGMLKCTNKCDIDTSGCAVEQKCGNGKLDADEFCDGKLFIDNEDSCAAWGDYASGKVTCSPNCELVMTACVEKPKAKCGDGMVNTNEEDCDKNAFFADVTSCKEYDPKKYAGGTLKCTSGCKYDFSACKAIGGETKCGNGKLDEGEDCDGSKFVLDVTSCSEYSDAYGKGNLKCTKDCKYDFSSCEKPICADGSVRCDGNKLEICMADPAHSPVDWHVAETCSGDTPVCDSAVGDCVRKPLEFNWCTFHWLDVNDYNKGYGRALLPNDKTVNDVMAYMACTTSLEKPVSDWTTVTEAYHNASCGKNECGDNKEFMTGYTMGEPGINYCTFIFEFDEGTYACRPQQSGEAKPILIEAGKTKLGADMTRTFTIGSTPCDTKKDAFRCNGQIFEMCENNQWIVGEVCQSSQKCDVNEGCVNK